MTIWGKIIGSATGFALGGPIGAMLGGVAGHALDKFKTNLSVIKSVIKSNENRSKILLDRINKILNRKIKNKIITFLGVTFKANTDDMRDSSSLKMIPWLSKKGAIIKYFDPTGYKTEFMKFKNVINKTSIKDAVHGADLVIIHTEWNDFKSINFKKFSNDKLLSSLLWRSISLLIICKIALISLFL